MEYVRLSGVATVLVLAGAILACAHILRNLTDTGDMSLNLFRFTGLTLLAIGLFGVCQMAFGYAGFIAWLIVVGVWTRTAVHHRRLQRRGLMTVLALASDKNMPLAPLVRAFASEQLGGFAERAQRLAARLEGGTSLADAVHAAPGTVGRDAVLAARVGAYLSDFPEVMRATGTHAVFDRGLLRVVLLRTTYAVPFLLYLCFFMQIKIAPSYMKIFSDFDVALPSPEQAVPMFGLLELLPPYDAPFWLWGTTDSWTWFFAWFTSGAVLFFILAWLQWHGKMIPWLPGLKRIINWVDMGLILRVLALAARRGRPLSETLDVIAEFHPKPSIRWRIGHVVGEISRGQPWTESLCARRLISRADAAVLDAAQRCGNLPWAMTEMAESFERRAGYRMQAWGQVAIPLLVLPLGAWAALQAITYFYPLTILIRSLT